MIIAEPARPPIPLHFYAQWAQPKSWKPLRYLVRKHHPLPFFYHRGKLLAKKKGVLRGGPVWSPLQRRLALSLRPTPRREHYWRSPVFVLSQQTPRRVLNIRQRSRISAPPLPPHKLRPSEPLYLFRVACDVLTDVVWERGLRRPRNASRPLGGRF